MKKALIFCLILVALAGYLSAEDDVRTINLDDVDAGGVRAGFELGVPITGITAGYHMSEKLEVNLIVGSLLDFNSVALGGSVLYTLFNFEIQEQNLPLNLGPVAYCTIGSEYFGISAGALARIEYDFEFPLNLYFQSGMIVNIVKDENDPLFNWPFALGVRYIF